MSPPATIRPLTAISDVNLCTPAQLAGAAPLLLSYNNVPSSPSKPLRAPPFGDQTIGSFAPLLLVEMGARLVVSPLPIAPHQALEGMGGMPAAAGLSKNDMTWLSLLPPGH